MFKSPPSLFHPRAGVPGGESDRPHPGVLRTAPEAPPRGLSPRTHSVGNLAATSVTTERDHKRVPSGCLTAPPRPCLPQSGDEDPTLLAEARGGSEGEGLGEGCRHPCGQRLYKQRRACTHRAPSPSTARAGKTQTSGRCKHLFPVSPVSVSRAVNAASEGTPGDVRASGSSIGSVTTPRKLLP